MLDNLMKLKSNRSFNVFNFFFLLYKNDEKKLEANFFYRNKEGSEMTRNCNFVSCNLRVRGSWLQSFSRQTCRKKGQMNLSFFLQKKCYNYNQTRLKILLMKWLNITCNWEEKIAQWGRKNSIFTRKKLLNEILLGNFRMGSCKWHTEPRVLDRVSLQRMASEEPLGKEMLNGYWVIRKLDSFFYSKAIFFAAFLYLFQFYDKQAKKSLPANNIWWINFLTSSFFWECLLNNPIHCSP